MASLAAAAKFASHSHKSALCPPQVFAYGQTGSGKTFTMGTAASSAQMAGPREHCGVIPRVINYIFTHLPALQANYSVTMAVSG